MKGIKLTTVQINLDLLSKEYASFQCGENVKGVIHSPSEDGPYTVTLDGGHLLGRFTDEEDTIKKIAYLNLQINEASEAFGMDYQAYKRVFTEGAASRSH
jgi:hypothetical protein